MVNRKMNVSVALSTFLVEEKVARLAGEAAVTASLVESRFMKGNHWINDFEVEGQPGKVEAFLRRVKDIETR